MFKTGIYQRERLTIRALESFFGRRKFIAITLYPEIASGNDPDRDCLLEHILRRFSTANGTYKRTRSHRFDDFDAHIVRILREQLDLSNKCAVHDIAVSDGRTAVELFQCLKSIEHINLDFLATDAFTDLTVVSSKQKALIVVIEPESMELLQIILPPFVFNVWKRESLFLYPLNRLVLNTLLRTSVRSLLKGLAGHDPAISGSHVRLLSPECVQLMASDTRFRFDRYSIFEPAPKGFMLVRAMNVLNRSYFSDAALRLAAENIHTSLIPGGLFATGSNRDDSSSVDGAIYQRTDSGFKVHWVSGAGSQIDEIVSKYKFA